VFVNIDVLALLTESTHEFTFNADASARIADIKALRMILSSSGNALNSINLRNRRKSMLDGSVWISAEKMSKAGTFCMQNKILDRKYERHNATSASARTPISD
jgi:hypothetical protein